MSLKDGVLISSYIKHHKPTVMKETGLSEERYESIYHVQRIMSKLEPWLNRQKTEQVIYAVMDAVRCNDPKVRKGLLLISRKDQRCIIHNCEQWGVYAATEAETESNKFVVNAIVDDGQTIFQHYTDHLKMVFLCGNHATLNKKGFGFDEILLWVARQPQEHYFFKVF